ncbi:two-component regulator propeller domain-containing protein [Polaribacter undariae]|uniref:histidine kinase n=1 Tax=Polaribacter sejongensis TaxID=985043 RepID=A0AAJ1QYI3_9FLAO|nr:hybrid sensor histidine kinase/response regulator transcription factor [Polaribacter undariae]MDN3620440.1 two-component regulator propeller domain-containing protein [Polaribacter undariae]UWD33308.1 ATP-binding protein [Polaribacter undariae]
MKNLLVLILFLSSIINYAQKPYKEFQFVNIKEGIPKVGVSSIVQDNQGFIWIGTTGTGLYKFDGIDYTPYKFDFENTHSLSNNLVQCLFLDSKNRLWCGTENGLNLYDRDLDHFKKVQLNTDLDYKENVFALEEDAAGNLLVGTDRKGLYKLDINTLLTERILNKKSPDLSITSIRHTKQGKTFVGTNLGLKEIDFIHNKLIDTRIFAGEEKSINHAISNLYIDAKDNLWIGFERENGVYKCGLTNDRNNNIIRLNKFDITSKKIMKIIQLSDSTLMIGTENDGLFHLEENGDVIKNYVSNKTEENSILHNSIWELFIDKNDRIWMGYFNSGVAVSDKLYDKFKDIKSLPNKNNSLTIPSVSSVVKDKTGNLWISTDGGGIDVYNPKNAKITHINKENNTVYSGLNSNYIVSLFLDSKNNLWAGSWDNGIYLLKNGSKKFINFSKHNPVKNFKANTVRSFSEDSKGTIWIATFFEGLHSYTPTTNTFTKFNSKEFVAHQSLCNKLMVVFVDAEDAIWVGTADGLFRITRLENDTFNVVSLKTRMQKEYGHLSDVSHILSIYESSKNEIWIGTRGAGLCRYNKKEDTYTWYNKSKGFEEENIAAIIEDNDKNIWVSGNSGLTKIDIEEEKFTNYTSNDGLLSNDFNFGAVLKDEKGILYFGDFKGLDYFNPKEIATNASLPSLHFTDFKLFNEKVIPLTENSPLEKVISETKNIQLSHTQSVFTIEYTGLNYTRPEKNNYAYYLEGYETTWNYVGHKRNATYTNLDHGDYIFKLKASNNDGVWSNVPLELNITILPPWWKTNWAILGYILVFLLCIYLLNSLTQQRIKEKEILKNERLAQSQNDELNQKKLQFFTNISHEFRTPLTLIINPIKDIISNKELDLPQSVKNKHAIIYKNTNRLYRLINELMDIRKLEHNKMKIRASKINLIEFSKNIANYFQEETTNKNILLSVDSDVPDLSVWADEKMLEKIIFNLLSNAIKATPIGGAINIDLFSNHKRYLLPLIDKKQPVEVIEIVISDTGTGLNEQEVEKIFERFYQVEDQNKTYIGGTGIGLEVVKSFVYLHKGDIKVESKVGSGTTFKILLPTGNAHYTEDQIIYENEKKVNIKEQFLLITPEDTGIPITEVSKLTKTKTILIVEDNIELLDYLKIELSKEYKVFVAGNGKEGIKKAKETLPDAIITDVVMPEMDGFEFCKTIKTDASTSHIPVMMLTARTTIENRIEGIENGADAYMIKPFDLKLLKLRLSQLITSRQLIFDKFFGAISGADEKINSNSIDKEFIQKLLEYINNNISDSNLSVEELASQLKLSRSQLYRKIKAITGQTVNEFIRKIRLERAKQILDSGRGNISEACFSVGFSSPSYFSKCFKAHFGILPSEIEIKKDINV